MTSDQHIDAFLDHWADLMGTVERAEMQSDLLLLVAQANYESNQTGRRRERERLAECRTGDELREAVREEGVRG